MNRRTFATTAAAASAGLLLKTQKAEAAKRTRLSLVTTWSPKMPILQDSAERFARLIAEATENKIRIKVFAGGELIPPLGVFDAVSSGDVEAGIGASYYWSGKVPAAPFFCAVPFGFDAEVMQAWLSSGGGQKLWEDIYGPHNLVPMSIGNTGPQMAGWFKEAINSPDDLQGLKMRIPGLGGKVMAKAGVNVVLLPGGELYTALERGTIDATEWVSPFHDERLGLHRAAKYCYYPGWQEPSANLELVFNSAQWSAFSRQQQSIIRACAAAVRTWAISSMAKANAEALKRLQGEHKVQVLELPASVLETLKAHSKTVLSELAASNTEAKAALESYEQFRANVRDWEAICLKSSSFL